MCFFYAGDVLPNDAFSALKSNADSYLIDVRTHQEWYDVGVPDISVCSKRIILLSWKISREVMNRNFISDLSNFVRSKDSSIYFLCRSGVRSAEAATAAADSGYKNSYNIMPGFEGESTSWKSLNLPLKRIY